MKILIKSILFLATVLFFGCNSVGADLAELPLSSNKIVSSDEIVLKKGETITIWTKLNVATATPDFKIRYLIEESGSKMVYDSLSFLSNEKNHIINSSAFSEEVIEKTSGDKDSIVIKRDFLFELKTKDFEAPKDGKYTFDFKMTKGDTFNGGFSIILRK
jgi:hypothetical protein